MKLFYLIAGLLLTVVCSTTASAAHLFSWRTWEIPLHHHHRECSHVEARPTEQGPPGDGDPFSEGKICSCTFYIGDTEVFRRQDSNGWYSCSRRGLHRCEQYCIELFQDQSLRNRTRQGACDVLNREISTPWYQRNQVCGYSGPYQDNLLPMDLCCQRGRPCPQSS